ncbi:MAG: hypothetical protein IJX78_05700 [Bacilli bacterium]|nr:hypothetical protein [Bacilli bacterium]
MNKLINEFKTFKILMYDSKYLKIENYHQILDINKQVIKIDNYLIEGDNLKIDNLNQFVIEIYGEIKKISIE